MFKNTLSALAVLLLIIESGCREPAEPLDEQIPLPAARIEGEGEATAQVEQALPASIPVPAEESVPPPDTVELQPLGNDGTWMVTASSQEGGYSAEGAVDGSLTTRWGSEFADNQWWLVDFGQEQVIGRITLHWESAFGRRYRLWISPDGARWEQVFAQEDGMGGTEKVEFEPRAVRKVKLECLERATQWGFSLLEMAFNEEEPAQNEATASSGSGDYAAKYAIDGKMNTRWSSNFSDSEWWQLRFSEPRVVGGLKILWETAFAEKYEIQVSSDGSEWKTVYDVQDGDGQTDILFFEPVEIEYLRIMCNQRGTGWGNSIWEVFFYDGDKVPVVSASSEIAGADAGLALDGDPETAWHSDGDGEQWLAVQLPESISLGGVELTWGKDFAKAYAIQCSADGNQWKDVLVEEDGNGDKDYLFFAETAARHLRVLCRKSGRGSGYALAQMEFKSGEEKASPLRYYQAEARDATPGRFPMWLTRQQEFWTVTGVPDDPHETLIGETGIIEPHKGDFCVQPFLLRNGRLLTYADVELDQRLDKDMLPLPSVTWSGDTWKLDISAVAFGPAGASATAVRYRLVNHGPEPFRGQLALAVRPIQLNPIWQKGGMSPIRDVACLADTNPAALRVNGITRMVFASRPDGMGAAPLAEGDAVDFLAKGKVPPSGTASDPEGRTSAAIVYDLDVPPSGSRDVVVVYLLHDASKVPEAVTADPAAGFAELWAGQAAAWEKRLDRLEIDIPEDRIIKVLKSNLAYVLINRDSPWFKPGPRNYNHAWMRDGALTGWAMLRLGKAELPGEFIRSFSGFIGDNGWVPYIIMEDGNPVGFNHNAASGEGQEYDSQGEYVFIVRQYYDYTGDQALLEQVYPKVVKALQYAMEVRRRRMTDEYRNDPKKRIYYGILQESNSHEGYYPAKHSYWDDFWMLRGLKDGACLAERLGKVEDAKWMREEEADLRKCLYASMRLVMEQHKMDVLPGCAELGDRDPTSTTIAIMACSEQDHLPQPFGQNTFDFYWDQFSKRLEPGGEATFTPYEIRNADVFVRIGQRDRALAMVRKFTSDYTHPYGWNHMAEVVHAKVRAPSYIGDMPHTWVGSDFLNAVCSMFAYDHADALVLAAGVDPAWLDEGVTVKNMPTRFGEISYTMRRRDGDVVFSAEGSAAPARGFVLRLPESLAGLSEEIDGQPGAVTDNEVLFRKLPAEIRLFTPAAAEEETGAEKNDGP